MTVSPVVAPEPVSLAAAQARAARRLMALGPVVDEIGHLFADAGHEVALVGGWVRDSLLGRSVGTEDLDLATSARPEETLALLTEWADAVWTVGQAFGTIAARKGPRTIEVTTYRAESYDASSRKPDVTYGDTLEGDLRRRDFTVNAMALTLPNPSFVDPFDGLHDLVSGLLRTPGTPQESFSDDPLRMMRAARFAAQLGFSVDPRVVEAMADMAERLTIVSAERVRDELSRLVLGERPRILVSAGILPALIR